MQDLESGNYTDDQQLKKMFDLYDLMVSIFQNNPFHSSLKSPLVQNQEVECSTYNTEINWMRQEVETCKIYKHITIKTNT